MNPENLPASVIGVSLTVKFMIYHGGLRRMSCLIKVLDCTLRDGAYITNSKFGDAAIRGIIKKMQQARIDVIEVGWLKNSEHEEGSSYFHVPSDIPAPLSALRRRGRP